MLSAPDLSASPEAQQAAETALAGLRLDQRPGGPVPVIDVPLGVPVWAVLDRLVQRGYLLHGSPCGEIRRFEPRTPHDLSADDFSKRTGVFAASDGLWAMMYALRGPHVRRMLNMALDVQERGRVQRRYFLSLAGSQGWSGEGPELMAPGWVYVLPALGFAPMPPYEWPGLGPVREPHWVNPDPVLPCGVLRVTPSDFPLPVRTHDADTVDALCLADPWAFPWLSGAGS